MPSFVIDGKTMHYSDVGNGPAIVFGHSYLWDSQMWSAQLEKLSAHFRCIVPDFWGHGQSAAAPESMQSLQDYPAHICALMDSLSIDTFAVVGLSMGGMWGVELTAQYPQRVNALVLMDTFVGLEPKVTHDRYMQMLDQIAEQEGLSGDLIATVAPLFFAPDIAEKNPQLLTGFSDSLLQLTAAQAGEIARIGRMVFGRRDAIDELEKFALPVLITVGQHDRARTPLESYLMHDCITASQLQVIPDAGHISNLEQSELVNDILYTFLNESLLNGVH